jgi:acyl-CoA synthetase (AMP-forming)/AMP-acid ligase II
VHLSEIAQGELPRLPTGKLLRRRVREEHGG